MKTIAFWAAALLSLTLSTCAPQPAAAQSTTSLSVKDGTGTTQSIGAVACRTNVLCYEHATIDTTGAQIDPATKQLQQSMLAALGLLLQPGGKVDTVIPAASTDIGATVGTSAVTLAAASSTRRGFWVQVQTPGVSCYLSTLGAATADNHSLMLVSPSTANGGSGAFYASDPQHVGTGAISMICSAAGVLVAGRQF